MCNIDTILSLYEVMTCNLVKRKTVKYQCQCQCQYAILYMYYIQCLII